MLLNRAEESSSRTGLLYNGVGRFETRALALIKFGDFFKF